MVDAYGLSEASLEKGMMLMIEESKHMDKMMERHIISYELDRNREAAFNPEYPERFLDLPVIPDVKDEEVGYDNYENNEYYDYDDVSAIDVDSDEEESPEPWAASLPELENWNKHKSDSEIDDPKFSGRNYEDDPVYCLLKPFVHNIIEYQKDDYLDQIEDRGEDRMRSPLEHYLVILALKPQARIASCGVWTASVGHEAPRKGVYLFAMECLERIAEAIERFSQKHIYHLAAEARTINKQIEKTLVI